MESLTTYLIALATLAPGATTKGDLPPSSWQTRLTPPAAALAICTPTSVDPVKDTMSTSGCELSASPITEPLPVTRLSTPAGSPTCSQTSANTKHDSGVCSLGLSTEVQPDASAGPTLAIT